jgi:hypothetical protein
LLCGVSVIVSEDMCIGLQEESDVGVPDSLAEYLRAYAGFQRAGRVRVAQIVEGDAREPRGGGEAVESLPDRVGMRWSAVLKGEHVVAWVIVVSDLRRCWGRRVVVRFNLALTVVISRLSS